MTLRSTVTTVMVPGTASVSGNIELTEVLSAQLRYTHHGIPTPVKSVESGDFNIQIEINTFQDVGVYLIEAVGKTASNLEVIYSINYTVYGGCNLLFFILTCIKMLD